MKIWLDDQIDDPNTPNRHTPKGFIGVKNSKEFKKIILDANVKGEKVELIDFDNDLGEDSEEGYKLLEWLKDNYPEYVVGETEINIHSANIIRRKYMEQQIKHWKENREEILAMKERLDPWAEIKLS